MRISVICLMFSWEFQVLIPVLSYVGTASWHSGGRDMAWHRAPPVTTRCIVLTMSPRQRRCCRWDGEDQPSQPADPRFAQHCHGTRHSKITRDQRRRLARSVFFKKDPLLRIDETHSNEQDSFPLENGIGESTAGTLTYRAYG
ncbi:hypothetical protein DFH08DRAFT_440969 [Mycena albidolilacea]|uniref:Secreted protein n=1 Tax=Mycena albidolilacea TaxID=1033008 RepID=A0AAD7EYL9_9AGAR|nr:hypothetical protein DFH08DRAFT_440969 [Mycena albidolilacea]